MKHQAGHAALRAELACQITLPSVRAAACESAYRGKRLSAAISAGRRPALALTLSRRREIHRNRRARRRAGKEVFRRRGIRRREILLALRASPENRAAIIGINDSLVHRRRISVDVKTSSSI